MLRIPFVDQNANPAPGMPPSAMAPRTRFFAAVVGLGLLALLMLASTLRPDPRGLGTHQQLGLPPCTLKALAGLRCPACGMTTSWAYATRGQVANALRTHVGGTLLAVAAALTAALTLVSAVRGKWTMRLPSEALTISLIAVSTALVLGEWIARVWAG